MEKQINLESLRTVAVLYEGGFYDLARLLLTLWDARDREKNSRKTGSVVRSRPTVHYLAMCYSQLVYDVGTERVKEALLRHGLPLGAVVDDDGEHHLAPPGPHRTGGTGRRGGRRKRPAE